MPWLEIHRRGGFPDAVKGSRTNKPLPAACQAVPEEVAGLGRKVSCALATLSILFSCGCATAFVRSSSTVEPEQVFPATAFDAEFFWKAGVKGEPLFVTADPKQKNSPVARIAYGIGGIVDLPISVVFDTLLLPVDLSRPRKEDSGGEAKPENPR